MKNSRRIRKTLYMLMLLGGCAAPALAETDQASTSTTAEQPLIQPNNKKKSFAQELEELHQQNPLAYQRFQRMYGVNPDGTLKIPNNPESPIAPADAGSIESSKGK